MNKEIKKYDEKSNLIHCKYSEGWGCWKEFDKNNNLIHYKNTDGYEYWYKKIDGEQISITKLEFEQIKENEMINNYFNNNKVSRFELMDI